MPPPKKRKTNGGKTSSHATTPSTDENELFDLAMKLAFIAKGIRPSISVQDTVDILFYNIQADITLQDAVQIGKLIKATRHRPPSIQ